MKLAFAFLALLSLTALAEHGAECAHCRARMAAVPAVPGMERKYAPDREIDVQHLALEVTPDFEKQTVAGTAKLTFKPIAKPLEELVLDAVELAVESVESSAKVRAHHSDREKLTITFAEPLAAGAEASVTIRYRAEPKLGLYFRTEKMGYPKSDTHVFSQGETSEARHWYPCYDAPNEKFTSEVTCRVPAGMVALSNGKKIAEVRDAASGLTAVTWRQEQPHTSYLITLCAGFFKGIEDKVRDVPLGFWTPPSLAQHPELSFAGTKEIIEFFEKETGTPYPWAKYDQVVVTDFMWGGMENTSQTTLTHNTLFAPEFETIRSSEGLVAHELAHQWFGDLVTCKDWSHIWLNEGFATYYEALFEEHKRGADFARYDMLGKARGIYPNADDPVPIVWRAYATEKDMFGYRSYPKGGWVVHMLRAQLGPELWREVIKTYLARHRFGTVVTEDLNAVIEELSGRSFDQFFDQWVYHGGIPQLAVSYAWDERRKQAKLSISQTQKVSADVLLFRVPLKVRFKTKAGVVEREIAIAQKDEDFFFALPAVPEQVRLDPSFELLAKITFKPGKPMLYAQLVEKDDAFGRLLAAEALGEEKDRDTVEKLKAALNGDTFWPVRHEASKALAKIHTDEAWAALRASLAQPEARVRVQVVRDLAGFFRAENAATFRELLAQEKNPDVAAAAIHALAPYGDEASRAALLAQLATQSFRQVLADAALGAMRAQDHAGYLAPLLDTLKKREAELPTRVLANGLGALGWLAREEKERGAVREFIAAKLTSPRERVRLAAIEALGTLGDPEATAALETFARADRATPERGPAEAAVRAIRERKTNAADLGALRGEVTDLQKLNRELRKEFDELKKKLEPKDEKKPAAAAKGKTREL